MPRVSVIVPNYNHAQFLKQRLDSVLGQTFADFEVLLLDDASTDASREVIRRYSADPRIRVFLNETNGGTPFKQWNKGIEIASGEFIWIAESDDYSDPRFLQVLVDKLESCPSAALAYCQSLSVLETGEQSSLPGLYSHFANADRWAGDYCNSGTDELVNYLVFQNIIPNASAVVFRRKLMDRVIRAPEHMQLCGDWMFWSELANQGKVCYVAEALNYFRRSHGQSQRFRTAKQALEVLEGFEVFEFIATHVDISPVIRTKVMRQQIKRWASFAYQEDLEPGLSGTIRSRLLKIHPELASSPFRRVSLPYAFHYAVMPIKQIHWFGAMFRRLRSVWRQLRRRFLFSV